jgi:hypothetical protein
VLKGFVFRPDFILKGEGVLTRDGDGEGDGDFLDLTGEGGFSNRLAKGLTVELLTGEDVLTGDDFSNRLAKGLTVELLTGDGFERLMDDVVFII